MTSFDPLISIVTPSFNSMPYIRANIESVLKQNYQHFEHIIIDGNSTDETIELLKSFDHLNWISEKDTGQSNAINKGFRQAQGEIIGWLNSDDTYNEGTFEQVVDYFSSHHEIDLIYTDVNIIDQHNTIIGQSQGEDFDLHRLLTFNMIKQPSLFMRRRVLDGLGGLDERLHYVMDHEFWLRAGMKGYNFKYLKHNLYANFRLIPGTKSYESAVDFAKEWNAIVIDRINDQFFSNLKNSSKRSILRVTKSGIFVSQMIKSHETSAKLSLINNFIRSIWINPSLILNTGIWKFLILGFLGIKHDKINKFL